MLLLNIAKYWNYRGFLSAWGDLLCFSVPGGTRNIAGLWFARGISTQADTVTRSSHRRCSIKRVFLKISQNSHENTCARVSFLIKLEA